MSGMMMRAGGGALILLGILAGWTVRAEGISLRGTSSTAVYTQEVAKGGTGDDFENRTRLFERLRFQVLDLGHPQVSFNGYVTARNDLTNESFDDTRARVYHAYLEWRSTPGMARPWRTDVRFGRQWVSAGVGSGTMDGVFLHADHRALAGVSIFAGTLGIEARDASRFDSPDDSRRLGGELRIHPTLNSAIEPEVALSAAGTWRDNNEDSRRIGARASLFVRRQLRLWSEVRHDFLLDRTFGNAAGIEFMKPSSALRLWAEYNRRTPDFPASSFFAVFDTKPVAELRGGAGIGLGGPYRASADFTRTDFKEPAYTAGSGIVTRSQVDRSTSYRFVLQRDAIQAGIRFQNGFGGDRFGLVASADQRLSERWDVRLDLGYESYDYGSLETEDNTVASGLLAASYRPFRDTRLTAQIEGLNNRDLKRDVRLLARLDQRFALGR